MAKKYLLYIHHDKFAAEEHKSQLINDLLERYYSGCPSSVKIEAVIPAAAPRNPLPEKPIDEYAHKSSTSFDRSDMQPLFRNKKQGKI